MNGIAADIIRIELILLWLRDDEQCNLFKMSAKMFHESS
jgi:hypothetical protein